MAGKLLVVLLAPLALVGASVAAMAIGVVFRRPCLRGSCGGTELRGRLGESLSCTTCPNRRRTEATDAVTGAVTGAGAVAGGDDPRGDGAGRMPP
jgi:hypothetical protein